MKIAVVAPASPLARQTAEKVSALAASLYGEAAPEIYFHPQCFLSEGHFAGSDADRSMALLDVANDGLFDAVWFGRGGYGSCRIEDRVFGRLNDAARRKIYLGYSDMGSLLARLYGEKIGQCVHGPMPQDINRVNGAEAVTRALSYLVDRNAETLEPTARAGKKVVAFNLMTLSHLLSAPWRPDLSGHILMLEEVSEYHYRIDRAMFTVTSDKSIRAAAGIMLGRCSDIPGNDVDFGKGEEEICRYWCTRAAIPYLGRADIGHDSANKIVPFGAWLAT